MQIRVSENVIQSLEEALTARELVKTRVLKNCLEEPQEVAQELSQVTGAHLVQVVGRNILLYRPSKISQKLNYPK